MSPRRADRSMAPQSWQRKAGGFGHRAAMRIGSFLEDRRRKHATDGYNGKTNGSHYKLSQ